MPDVRTPREYYYESAGVVDAYDAKRDLLAGEAELFDSYVHAETRLLDLGIGAGRTTRILAPRVKSYIGIDLAPLMVERATVRFPGLDLSVGDAADLSRFDDGAFDAVLFSFNGLGVLPSDEARSRCFEEVARVLLPGGVFIFSLHYARYAIFPPKYEGVGALRAAWRTLFAARMTVVQAATRLPSPVFWRGAGFVKDHMQPGAPVIYACRPRDVRDHARAAGLLLERVAGGTGAGRLGALMTPYLYYACRKPPAAA
jgi:SAM-dependent methyltransferase